MSTYTEQFIKVKEEPTKEELVNKIKELEQENLKLKAKIKELPKNVADDIKIEMGSMVVKNERN